MAKRKKQVYQRPRRHLSLDGVIDQLYAAYEGIRPPKRLDSCDCCHTEAEKTHLLTTPVRLIDEETALHYCYEFAYTIGEPADFQYFVPRMLEVIYLRKDDMALGDFTRSLERANTQQWSTEHYKAMERVYRALCHQLDVEPFACE